MKLCNKKRKLIGNQEIIQGHKKINGQYDWSPDAETEDHYLRDSICTNGHIEHWGSKKPIKTLKFDMCTRPINNIILKGGKYEKVQSNN